MKLLFSILIVGLLLPSAFAYSTVDRYDVPREYSSVYEDYNSISYQYVRDYGDYYDYAYGYQRTGGYRCIGNGCSKAYYLGNYRYPDSVHKHYHFGDCQSYYCRSDWNDHYNQIRHNRPSDTQRYEWY
jgi:hypothetical protein